ncbi:alpha/beta fold hydrolase [Streptomyces geranii]|uniref:alpha/beta fold hydrolase n=1 Tax=Streptomyces geranii TaxID=2058923 RepID=UPI000D043EFC|nr:alpha/beta hydrolase [Streptomyces geranii]
MPTVFVHGFPETQDVWEPLLAELERSAQTGLRPHPIHPIHPAHPIRLSPPGFGAPVPTGFGATVGDYRDWLIGELERFAEPVDLVGHDWGGAHVVNAVMARPDLVRSWVSDVIGLFDPEYVWHEFALGQQAPENTDPAPAVPIGRDLATRVAVLVRLGMSEPVAKRVAAGQDETMGRVAHTLYRSATQPAMAELGRTLERAARRPGLSLLATEDHLVGTDEQRVRTADRAGARTVRLDGLGHWWMTQDPVRGAKVLTDFWDALDR